MKNIIIATALCLSLGACGADDTEKNTLAKAEITGTQEVAPKKPPVRVASDGTLELVERKTWASDQIDAELAKAHTDAQIDAAWPPKAGAKWRDAERPIRYMNYWVDTRGTKTGDFQAIRCVQINNAEACALAYKAVKKYGKYDRATSWPAGE